MLKIFDPYCFKAYKNILALGLCPNKFSRPGALFSVG
jgi:hypothetical protein